MFQLSAVGLLGQSSSFVLITPDTVNMLMGESRTFRLVDRNGNMQRNVSWTISDNQALQADDGDELVITAKRAGDFRIAARAEGRSAEATVKVLEGTTLPTGTGKWSAGTIEGCKSTQVVPAVPSANGPDVFQQTMCEDGPYVSAYSADGIMLWRHKIGASDPPVAVGAPLVAENRARSAGTGQLNLRSKSICDAVAVGADQQKIRDLLSQRNLAFRQDTLSDRAWIVEEPTTQCELWFDDKSVLTKKRKMFVSE